MGARCTFVFKQSENFATALYSHWGEDSMYQDLAAALQHASPRMGDESYYIRMAVSYLLKDNILDETGYGLWACDPNNLYVDHPVLIDLVNRTVEDDTGTHSIEEFIAYHAGSLVTS
jgi:hypothetical protein